MYENTFFLTPSDYGKERVICYVRKHLFFWGSSTAQNIAQNPWNCFFRRTTNVTFSKFRIRTKKQSNRRKASNSQVFWCEYPGNLSAGTPYILVLRREVWWRYDFSHCAYLCESIYIDFSSLCSPPFLPKKICSYYRFFFCSISFSPLKQWKFFMIRNLNCIHVW